MPLVNSGESHGERVFQRHWSVQDHVQVVFIYQMFIASPPPLDRKAQGTPVEATAENWVMYSPPNHRTFGLDVYLDPLEPHFSSHFSIVSRGVLSTSSA